MSKKILVFIPTYNEFKNVSIMYDRIRKLVLDTDLLFLDDNSPDGTGAVLDAIAAKDGSVRIIHRSKKLGIGSAHQEGIRWAYDHGYQTLITMDCDFTHQPEDIRVFLENSFNHDIVVGNRYINSHSLEDWNLLRKFLTVTGHLLTELFLKMPYDATGAFRLYHLDRIPRGVFSLVGSRGYSFFFESLYVLGVNGFTVKEVGIIMPARAYGHSKMTVKDAYDSLKLLGILFFRSCLNKKQFQYLRLNLPESVSLRNIEEDEHEWDYYWEIKKKKSNALYDNIAVFYRKCIIKRTLNCFIKKTFKSGAVLLHAGCGGGQVDTDVVRYAKVTALDISQLAIDRYQKLNGSFAQTVRGSIFEIPLPDNSMDGVYNLGVMEHFSEEDIGHILKEFYRILKPQGKVLLFWPPEFGLSVIFLKGVLFILNGVLKKNIKLHPDEITRILSKKHASRMLKNSNFELKEYYFGVKDAFTYVILTAERITM